MEPRASHLHTFFLFPFSIDKHAVLADHDDIWPHGRSWFDGVDEWVGAHAAEASSGISALGKWQRSAYQRFDLDSEAYEIMTAFHPFVRRVFFDVIESGDSGEEQESLLNTYTLPIGEGRKLFLTAGDIKGRSARIEITALRLFLFANGIGILSIGVEARGLPVSEALWMNKMMRKVFPSNQHQILEARGPNRLALTIVEGDRETTLVEERFENARLVAFQPPLSKTIQSLLYFTDYLKQEYEPVLDERMVVYSYMAVDGESFQRESGGGQATEVLLSRFMFVDNYGEDFRYDPGFTHDQMKSQVYRRWAHQGTYFGFTSYSNVALTFTGVSAGPLHTDRLVHRVFNSRYYMISIIALFYRCTLLDYSEQTALVSKRLYIDQAEGKLRPESIRIVNQLRADFLHFSNYWLFEELANKDEEMDHFWMLYEVYHIDLMKSESDQEIEKLNTSLHEYYEQQSAAAVNRLAISSMTLGAGAVVTGYFGMNFEREFGEIFFGPGGGTPVFFHYAMIAVVSLFAVAALAFSGFIVIANWADYRYILVPRSMWGKAEREISLRRGPHAGN